MKNCPNCGEQKQHLDTLYKCTHCFKVYCPKCGDNRCPQCGHGGVTQDIVIY